MPALARSFARNAIVSALAGLGLGRGGGEVLGPELVSAFPTNWTATGTTPPTIDGTGAHFAAASNIASALNDSVTLKDNTLYEIVFTISNYSGGGARVIISGATTAHGFTGTTRNANGTYTERGVTNGASTSTTAVRVQATGGSGTNTFDVTLVSVREVIQN